MSVHWRSIIEEIKATAPGYVLAVSGGLDSMFLLDVFERNLPSAFRVAHFDHGLRDASADEQRFVRNWCASRGVEFHGGRGDPEAMRTASSMEAEARRQRYGFLESLLGPGELVVTAHHANDQIETVIMRLMRGVPEGKLRMRKVEGRRYRPLLGVPRADIERQAKARGLDTCSQGAWNNFWSVTRRVLNVPDDEYIICGMSLGYADETAPVNTLIAEREPVENFATFHGFE